ncbi:predicted transcriptional regulator YdeE [Bacillus oleivorans]|uniref:Predicted transcriptional regulator YdeE n=1 Tax=Bacillus oleivorans TaxID=1448271 RepID=A0A285CWH8_9BACI|nr:GyrI-like domain-containing protein [Bacillus oleivorans]SNX71396.1 predicted transcriptional regulator YdeE [Bacillus oleivorans]
MIASIVKQQSFTIVGYSFKANLKEIEEQELGKKTLHRLKDNQMLISNKLADEVLLIQIYDMKLNFNPYVDPFTQIIGYKVKDGSNVPDGMIVHQVPENNYVTCTHKGLEAELYKTYDYLYGKWLAENSYSPAGYDFEVWDERYKPEEHENEIDVYVALK